MKASQAWMEWVMKKRKAFDQRGDMVVAAWADQQQREMTLRAQRLSRSKIDPEEERSYLNKEKKASMEFYSTTLKRHTLVLWRDIMQKKAEEDRDNEISRLLASEGLELDTDEDENKTFFGVALLILTPNLFSSSIPATVEDPVTMSTQGNTVILHSFSCPIPIKIKFDINFFFMAICFTIHSNSPLS